MAAIALVGNMIASGGGPASGCKLTSCIRSTSTPSPLYSDVGLATPTTNPYVGDADGRLDFYFSSLIQYTWTVRTADNAQIIWQADVVGGVVSVTYTDAALIHTTWAPPLATALGSGWAAAFALPAAGVLDNLNGIRFVSTYAALTALTEATGLADNAIYCTYGRASEEDGGFGFWRYDSDSTTTADSGTVLAIDGGGAGRFFRIFSGPVNVKWFGAKGDGATSDTAALQAALNTTIDVAFPAGTYLSGPLTQVTSFQRIFALGQVVLKKNADGVILTSSGIFCEFHSLQFDGAGFTGDNISSSGSSPRFINCSSVGAAGRALKATGNHVQILGTCGSYTTTDATGTGYDIEIGVSGMATLYHQLEGVYSSQATGGILLIDTGSHSIRGGQFGKLTIRRGTGPGGSNGGMTLGARVLGQTDVELSSAIFTGNQFGSITLTFASGTSGCSLDASNIFSAGASVVNSGNANSVIVRATSSGSTMDLSHGPSAWTNTTKYFAGGDQEISGNMIVPNNRGLSVRDSGGTSRQIVSMSASDNMQLGANVGTAFTNIFSGSGGIYLGPSGTSVIQITSSTARPQTDNAYNQGSASQRYADSFSNRFRPGNGDAIWTTGTGSPEGTVTAPVGSFYGRLDGGAVTSIYAKETGAGNTGWVAK